MGNRVRTVSAKDAKYGFGRLVDFAWVEPVAVARHGRPAVEVMVVVEHERLKGLDAASAIESKLPRNRNTEKF
jgi:hypothetical protein